MEELAEQPIVRVVNALCPSGTSRISNYANATMSKMVTSNSPKNFSLSKNLVRRLKG